MAPQVGIGAAALRAGRRRSRSEWLVRGDQVLLNAFLLGAGVWLAWSGYRRALLLLALVPLVFVPFSYARLRLHRRLASHLSAGASWFVAIAGVGCDALMGAQLVGARQLPDSSILQSSGVVWLGTVWFSAHALLLVGYGLTGLVRRGVGLVHRAYRAARADTPKRAPAADEVLIGRRALLQRTGLLGAAIPFGVSLSSVSLSYDFRVEERQIELPFWPPALDGLRVAHLSDIHVGGLMNRERLQRVADLTNAGRPDLVLHTGDFLTHRAGDFDAPLYDALARIRAPYGQWACFGNHDYDDPERLERRLRGSGVVAVRDRVATLSVRGVRLEIGGMEFVFGPLRRRKVYEHVLSGWGARAGPPRILLSHDPSGFYDLPADCADLVLSGHTHGGHIGVQLTPAHAVTVVGLAGLPDQGVFRRGDMRMYVTRCVGFYGYPMRIGIPPEIALLVLRAPRKSTPA